MPRLILLLAVIAVVYLLLRRVRSLPPHRRRGEYVKLGLGVIVVAVIALTVTGRMHWLGAALTAALVALRQALPLLIRLFPLLAIRRAQGAPGGSRGQRSTVETAALRMHLDHDNGELQGEVLTGRFAGWRLAELDRAQLQQLYRELQGVDQDAVQLLDSYLQQRFPGDQSFAGAGQRARPDPGGDMGRAEALAVLGLAEGATEEEIVAAHRRLIQKLHPDRGGNDYLAAKINQAKDVLLQG